MSNRRGANTIYANSFHRERVKTILLKRYRSKFSTKKNIELDKVLYREIDELLKNKNLNQTHLSAIEKKIASLTKASNKTTICASPSMDAGGSPKVEDRHLDPNTSLPPIRTGGESVEEDQWTRIIKHDMQKYIVEQRDFTLQEKEKKRKVKEELMKQINEKHNRSILERAQDGKYDDMLRKNVNHLEELEQSRVAERHEKIRREKSMRDQQLREEQDKKRRLQTEEKSREQRQLDQLKQKLNEEALAGKKKREQQLQEAVKLIQENEKYKLIQDSRKLKEREEDKKMLEEQARTMELQEKKYMDEVKAKEARVQALVKYAEEHVAKDEAVKKRLEEQRFIKGVIEREQREEIEERQRKKARKDNEVNAKKYLDEQMKEKLKKEEDEEKKSKEIVLQWRKDEEEFKQEQRTKSDELKKKNKAWYNDILQQATSIKVGKKKGQLMNERELLMNKKLLEGIQGVAESKKEP